MDKIKNYFKNYLAKNSKFKISTDFLFYLLIIFLLIPSTRNLLIRATLFRPKLVTENSAMIMKPEEYRLILEDIKGNTLDLTDYSKETIFISFWATWCPPCRAEMPSIQRLYNLYNGKMKMFLITNEEKTKVKSYLREFGYELPVYFQKSPAIGTLDVNSLPTSFLISSKGEILVHKKGAANWDSMDFKKKLENILNQTP
jgi:thiol-disulfide isomerase/thioredoxin